MSDKKRTPFLDAPIKPSRKHPQGLSRTGSDGTLKSTTVVTPTVFPSVRNERSPPPKRNSSSPTLKTMACNGSHSPVNGASGIHTRDTGSRKMPMFPPTHCRAGKSDSSESSASSTSSGLVFRSGEATVQVNRDDRLSDQSSCSASPARDQISPSTGHGVPKRPLLPPSMKSSESPEEDGRARTRPLPSPTSGSPSNMNRHRHKHTKSEDGSKSGRTISNQDGSNPDVCGLQSENEALKREIYHLQQRQICLREENKLLRQTVTSQTQHSDTSRPEVYTPVSNSREDTSTSPNGSAICEMDSPSPTPFGDCPSPGKTQLGSDRDVKLVARMQLSRVIGRAAKSCSPDIIDQKNLSRSISKSVIRSSTQPAQDSIRSPNPSVTSPLSPLSPSPSTPSPTTLVTFGLASQAKRRRGNNRLKGQMLEKEEPTLEGSLRESGVENVPQPVVQSDDPATQDNGSSEGAEDASSHESTKLGQFAGKASKSIVSATTRVFEGSCVSNEVSEDTGSRSKDKVKSTNVVSGERAQEESVSPDSDNVSSTSSTQTKPPVMLSQHRDPQRLDLLREAKSETQICPTEPAEVPQTSGVMFKRTQLKSDVSWIRTKPSTDDNGETSSVSTHQRSNSPSFHPRGSVTPPLHPYRSHQMLNSCSTPPPPSHFLRSQTVRTVPPRTFNTSQNGTAALANSSPQFSARHQHYQGLVNAQHQAPGYSAMREGERGGRVRRSPVSRSKGRGSETDGDRGMIRSASDESLQGTMRRGSTTYSSHRGEMISRQTQRPARPPPYVRNTSVDHERLNGRPSSVLMASGKPPRAWEETTEEDITMSCTVPSTNSASSSLASDKFSKRRFKKSSDSNPLGKKASLFGRLKVRARDKDQPRIPAPTLEEEESGGDTESSSEDEKGATIKCKPKLRPVSMRRPSQAEDDFDLSYPQLFERVFVVCLKQDPASKKLVTEVTYTFPPRPPSEKARDETMEAIPQFCFPDIDRMKPTTKFNSETFSFVLTNMEGHRRFGYCRRLLPSGQAARLPEVTCIVSPLGCFSLYEKILDHIEERRQVSTTAVFTFLKAIVANPFPKPGRSVKVRAFSARGGEMETVTFTRPLDSRLEHVDFSLLFATLTPRKIIQVFSSMLMERRIILCSNNLSLLTGCAHALLALLYPFEWQHVFIPVLPSALIDFVCSPLPYMMGMSPSLIPALDQMETMEEALVVDLDKKKFARKIGDEASILPSKLFQYLEHTLGSPAIAGEYQKSAAKRTNRADEIIINTFMIFFVYLYGDYRKYMKSRENGAMEFQKKEYEQKFSSKSIRRFLEAFHMTQMFENFVEQRENPLKSETTAQSTFERHSIHDMKDRCLEIEIFSSKSKISRWRLRKRI